MRMFRCRVCKKSNCRETKAYIQMYIFLLQLLRKLKHSMCENISKGGRSSAAYLMPDAGWVRGPDPGRRPALRPALAVVKFLA